MCAYKLRPALVCVTCVEEARRVGHAVESVDVLALDDSSDPGQQVTPCRQRHVSSCQVCRIIISQQTSFIMTPAL